MIQSSETKLGRPPHKPTPATRRKVEELVSCGMKHDAIARVIGITEPTMYKHYREELDTGAARKRAEVIGLLYKSAKKGNVSAAKKLEEMSRFVVDGEAMRDTVAAPMGKKAERQAAAEQVAGVYSVPEPPKLVVNNE